MSFQIRGGDNGSSCGWTFIEASADATALPMMPPTGIVPPSPAPFAPSGLIGDGYISSETPRMIREIRRRRQQVVGKRAGQELARAVIDQMFEERAAEALYDRADHLTVQRRED